LTAGIVLAVCVHLGFRVWNRVECDVAIRSEYRLEAHQIQIPPLPAWIHADVKAEALRDGSLDGPLSILDQQLAERLERAFALHPWVSRVLSVEKHYPARVTIDLHYRRPAAMVAVRQGLFPIDEQAVLLPSADFSTAEARKYPRIAGIESQPLGPAGTAWGDAVVLEAVVIVVTVGELWNDLGLDRVQRTVDSSDRFVGPEYHFELVTKRGTSIPWGRSPGKEESTEATAAEKIARLKEFARRQGGLDETPDRINLDLRARGGTRTAARPGT